MFSPVIPSIFVNKHKAFPRVKHTKKHVFYVQGNADDDQLFTQVIVIDRPCVISGLRWDLSALLFSGGARLGIWIFVVVPSGDTLPNLISNTNMSNVYQPTENIIAFGSWALDPVVTITHTQGTSSASRKLYKGDQIFFMRHQTLAQPDVTVVSGIFQFFLTS